MSYSPNFFGQTLLASVTLLASSVALATDKSIYIITDNVATPGLEFEIQRFADDVSRDTGADVRIIPAGETPLETREILKTGYQNDNLSGVFLMGLIDRPAAGMVFFPGLQFDRSYYTELSCPLDGLLNEQNGEFIFSPTTETFHRTDCYQSIWLAEIMPYTNPQSQEGLNADPQALLRDYLDKNHANRTTPETPSYWFMDAMEMRVGDVPEWSSFLPDIVTQKGGFAPENVQIKRHDFSNAEASISEFTQAITSGAVDYVQLLTSSTQQTTGLWFPTQNSHVGISAVELSQLDAKSRVVELNTRAGHYTDFETTNSLLFYSDALLVVYDTSEIDVFDTEFGLLDFSKRRATNTHKLLKQGFSFIDTQLNYVGYQKHFIGDPTIKLFPTPETQTELVIEGHSLSPNNRFTFDIGQTSHLNGPISKSITFRNNGQHPIELERSKRIHLPTINQAESVQAPFFVSQTEEDIEAPLSFTRTLAPGESTEITVVFDPANLPNVPGQVNALLDFTADDNTVGSFIVQFTSTLLTSDTDGDGFSNEVDIDDDNDGFLDADDAFPLDASEWLDTDGDGIGNNRDTDDDNDGLPDAQDPLPLTAQPAFSQQHSGGAFAPILALLMFIRRFRR